ncbi:MAG TPA: VOC family protein [Chitinivibrionales bacterium]|nr:VOC family protein [Chitinivibrionales bacterium]
MIIKFASLYVKNQDEALQYYTTVLGFMKKGDVTQGEYRWLTVSSPEGVDGAELVLEAAASPQAQTYQKAMYGAGMPVLMLVTKDFDAEYGRLKKLGVAFRGEPFSMGRIKSVLFDDTCGNLVNLAQPAG